MTRAIHRLQYDYFRQLLVEAREASGLTQVEVAAKLEKPQSYVSKCERGERRVDLTEFVEIADALNLDVGTFLREYRASLQQLPAPVKSKKAKS